MPLVISRDVTSCHRLSDSVGQCSQLMKLYPACTQTTLYRFDVARSIAGRRRENGRDVDAWWSLLWLPLLAFAAQGWVECYIAVIFLLLHVTVFCKPMNASEATKQLLRRLALKLHNFGPSEIELKLVVSVNITVTGLSWVDYNLELNAPQFQSLRRAAMSRHLLRPVATQSLR